MIIVKDTGIQEKLLTDLKKAVQRKSDTLSDGTAIKALQALDYVQLPNARDEDWRYANIEFLLDSHFKPLSHKALSKNDCLYLETVKSNFPDSSLLVLKNGQLRMDLSHVLPGDASQIQLDKKISTMPFATEEHMENPFFYYLNQSNPSSIINVGVKGIVDSQRPLQIIHLGTEVDDFAIIQPSIRVTLQANAELSIVEHFSDDQSHRYFWNGVTQIDLGENSVLNYQKIQFGEQHRYWLHNTHIYQSAGSHISHGSYLLGSAWARNSTQVSYSGKNTSTQLYGVAIGSNNQYLDQAIKLNHSQQHANSDQLFKFVLADKSRGVFNGKILVQKEAAYLNAQQNNHNLLLNETAEMNAKPQLEILNQDVKCSHGSTIGQLDDEAMFYLRSRGIGEQKAKALLTEAFVFEVLDRVSNPVTKKFLKSRVNEKLNR